MGNFEKLSVLVIVVIIVMILVVALYTWSDNPDASNSGTTVAVKPATEPKVEQPRILIPAPLPPISGTPLKGGLPPTPSPFPPLINGPGGNGPGGLPIVPAPAPEAKPESTTHEIASGDTLGKLARQYHVSVAMIEEANPGVDAMRLRPRMKLTIPAPKSAIVKDDGSKGEIHASEKPMSSAKVKQDGPAARPGSVYTFVKGDTLPGLSKRAYGTADRWHEIWIANYSAIENPDVVTPGTRVKLPAK